MGRPKRTGGGGEGPREGGGDGDGDGKGRSVGSKRLAREGSADDPPDVCEFGDCGRVVKFVVHFRSPQDWVYYCEDHKRYARNLDGKGYTKTV